MNIKIIPAVNAPQRTKVIPRAEPIMSEVVENFINGKLSYAIQHSKGGCVNIEIPTVAYNDLKLFYQLCADALTPLGYKSEQSHDGGGMYSTLCVSW
jgi:hypothetical protein